MVHTNKTIAKINNICFLFILWRLLSCEFDLILYTCRPAGAYLLGCPVSIHLPPRWGYNIGCAVISIHLSLLRGLPSGLCSFYTLAASLRLIESVLRAYRPIASLRLANHVSQLSSHWILAFAVR